MKKTKYILSYGGGVNSSALFFHILEKGLPLDLVIFADTGEELKTTYQAVERIKPLCSTYGVEFITVKSDYGNLYDYYLKNKCIMSMMRRDCTVKFKVSPIRKYLRSRYDHKHRFNMYIGISYDEAHRIKGSNVKYITHLYPFVTDRITRSGNVEILKQNNFIAYKSGCRGCMYQSKAEWIRMFQENPEEFKRHIILEINGSRYPDILLNGSYSLLDLEKAFKDQKSLKSFLDINSSCNNINGGCFL